ncbi:uncharacterized protein LOC131879961 isoform X2 [Tigriopus californicus]|uniref:uncharacterized protein LOC131879961 isoform X2 n=1 Tax=Tigriopus californicus TaxID=6832 RepID=UPI0027DA54C5|nr:uncharacterized protein LOC131879961 isoform X2 [Tigriopus californicus]
MKFQSGATFFVLLLFCVSCRSQLLSAFMNLFSNIFHGPEPGLGGLFRGQSESQRGPYFDDGTQQPVATGYDEPYPADCGRNPEDGTGKLCFPDGLLCKRRVNRVGNENFNGQRYWMSWKSDDPQLRTAEWDWFNARNYCRKRCMDLVSIETREEYEFLKSHMGGVAYTWTSGRLCDFDGCDRPDFFPKDINGWFWSANQVRLAPTNSLNEFHDWSGTGGAGEHQPDNREGSESCLAVLNNFYGDGIKWHDVACHHEKPIICEDVPGHIQFARQNFPQLNIP